MKKVVFLMVVLVAAAVYAAWTPQTLRVTGANYIPTGYYLVLDTAHCGPDSLRVDTVYSDTLDISDATRLSVYLQLGAVTKATKGNDSVTIRMALMADAQTPYAGGVVIASDTFGGNNITAVDQAVRRINLLLDTVPAQRVWMRTIIGSRATDAFPTASPETTIVPINYYVLTR